jgi:ribosomal protein S7
LRGGVGHRQPIDVSARQSAEVLLRYLVEHMPQHVEVSQIESLSQG